MAMTEMAPQLGWLREIAGEIERDFPVTTRRTLLVLHDLDPDQLQAQWQVEPGYLALGLGAFPEGLTGVHARLRLLRADAGNQEVAELTLPLGALKVPGVARFVASGGPGIRYRAELGLATAEGGWLLLIRSNLATLPLPPPGGTDPGGGGMDGDLAEEQADAAVAQAPDKADAATRNDPATTLTQPAGAGHDVRPAFRVEERQRGSPPWDPTLVDNGITLHPEFPIPPVTGMGMAVALPPVGLVTGTALARGICPLIIARQPPPVTAALCPAVSVQTPSPQSSPASGEGEGRSAVWAGAVPPGIEGWERLPPAQPGLAGQNPRLVALLRAVAVLDSARRVSPEAAALVLGSWFGGCTSPGPAAGFSAGSVP